MFVLGFLVFVAPTLPALLYLTYYAAHHEERWRSVSISDAAGNYAPDFGGK